MKIKMFRKISLVLIAIILLATLGFIVAQTLKLKAPDQETQLRAPDQKPLFLDENTNKINIYNLEGKNIGDFYGLKNSSDKIVDARYFPDRNELAVIKNYTEGDLNKTDLVLINLQDSKERLIDSLSYKEKKEGAGFGEFLYPEYISSIKDISPDGQVISYSLSGWEYCVDVYYFLDINQKVYADSCNTTKWSPSGQKMVHYSTPGFATGPSLAFTDREKILALAKTDREYKEIEFDEVDWSEVKGDLTEILNLKRNEELKGEFCGIDNVFFIDEDNLILKKSPVCDPSVKYFLFDLKSKKIDDLKTPDIGYLWGGEYFIPEKNILLIISKSTSSVYSHNIINSLSPEIKMPDDVFIKKDNEGYVYHYAHFVGHLKDVIVFSVERISEGREMNYYYIDLKNKKIEKFLVGNNFKFVGWIE